MPYKSEKIRLPEHLDRRRKLSTEQKDEIKHKYSSGAYSLNGLAKEYNVSKKTVLLIVNPESKRKNDERIKEHWHDYQSATTERNKTVREHRAYKHQLYLDGKLRKEK